VAAALGASILLLSGCSDGAFVDDVTIVNDTEYSADVDVSGKERSGWLALTVVQPESTTTVEGVIDQGEVWVFRFDYIGEHREEVEISRSELEESEWTVEVPESFEEKLRAMGVPPPP
jgi:hypothetical protein